MASDKAIEANSMGVTLLIARQRFPTMAWPRFGFSLVWSVVVLLAEGKKESSKAAALH